jgi:putative phosphoesterase
MGNKRNGMYSTTIARLGVIGDVHCQDKQLKKSIEHIHSLGIDRIYCTGDVGDGIGSIHKCIQLLRKANVETVLGNSDEWLRENQSRALHHATQRSELLKDEIDYLMNLPRIRNIGTPMGVALLCHGIGANNMRKVNPDDYGYAIEANEDLQKIIRERRYRFLINGHSHSKMMRDIQGLLVINAGSLRDPRFLTIDVEKRVVAFWLIANDGMVLCEKEEEI